MNSWKILASQQIELCLFCRTNTNYRNAALHNDLLSNFYVRLFLNAHLYTHSVLMKYFKFSFQVDTHG